MAEYIDKSVLIAMCKGIAAFNWNKKAAPVSWADAYERFADEVEDFDAADVVEVVRCRDCVSHGNCLTEDTFNIARIENPYCCGGKRRESDG